MDSENKQRLLNVDLEASFESMYLGDFKTTKGETPMLLDEVRIGQIVKFKDSTLEDKIYHGEVTSISKDGRVAVTLKEEGKNDSIVVLNPGQLTLVIQVWTTEEKIISRINDLELRLEKRIRNSNPEHPLRFSDLRNATAEIEMRFAKCFSTFDGRLTEMTGKKVDGIVDRINFIGDQIAKMDERLFAKSNENYELKRSLDSEIHNHNFYKKAFIDSELKVKDLCERLQASIDQREDLQMQYENVCIDLLDEKSKGPSLGSWLLLGLAAILLAASVYIK